MENEVNTPIEMISCSEFLPGGAHEGYSNNPDFSYEQLLKGLDTSKFVCPFGLD